MTYDTGKHVLRFTADWCGPCRVYAPVFDSVLKAHDDITAHTIDIDDDGDEVSTYSVQSVPTTIYLVDGEEVGRAVGVITASNLNKMLT